MRSIGVMRERRRRDLVAQIQKLLAIGEHALIDLEDHWQNRGDEQRLALVAVLGVEIARHAVDLDRRNGFAQPDVGQRVGDVTEETGKLVGGARADRPQLDLPANGIARSGEAAVAEGDLAGRDMRQIVGLARVVAHERQSSRLGVHGEKRRLVRRRGARRADRRERQIGRDIDGRQRLAQAHACGDHGGPRRRKCITTPAFDRGPD